jgi:hypothetical protein
MNMSTIGRPAAIRPVIVSKPGAALEVTVYTLPANVVRREEVKIVRYRFNFWNIAKKVKALFKRKPEKLPLPVIKSVDLCADHGLAAVYWSVEGGWLEPQISFDGLEGPFHPVGNPRPALLRENTRVPLFYNYPNTTTAWVKVLGTKGAQLVSSHIVVVYVKLC